MNSKIEAAHLKRKAIVYIRQSTMRQVVVNTESTMRQYALKERLLQLGWDGSMIEIIDCDLGRSGAETTGRTGFRQMLADVGEGDVGAIACIECSRLSRSSGDWGRLMEICALSGTILIDDDGIYDPNDFNDRLLLGLKGTMSEAELHFLRERMRGGALSKAKRGDLRSRLPVGYLYNEAGQVKKDPDIQVQKAIMMFFESFRICGTAHKLALYYSEKEYLFPVNKNLGVGQSDIHWDVLTPARARKVLHSPTYAGIYTYGRRQTKNTVKGKKICSAPEEEWISNIENHHEAYISPDEYRENVSTLHSNCSEKGASPPREGSALLQGTVLCARCGSKMFSNYGPGNYRSYICINRLSGEPYTNKYCLSVNGISADNAVSDIILQRLTPEAVKAADDVLRELEKRKHSEDNYFVLQVERAKYEAELARKRYMNIDPENRLVSAELERLWNEAMTRLAGAEAQLRKYRSASNSGQTKTDMERLLALPEKLKKTWHDNTLDMADKKRIIRCLVEDVTLNNMSDGKIHVGIRFKGGLIESTILPRPLRSHEQRVTNPEIVEYVKEASKNHTTEEIAEQLKTLGKRTGTGLDFNVFRVRSIQQRYNIPLLSEHLRSMGYLSTADKAEQLGISKSKLNEHRKNGKFTGVVVKTSQNGDYMFAP